MNKWVQIICLAAVIVGISVRPGLAQQKPQPKQKPTVIDRAVRRIEENARAVKHNASIYQWERVDDEVDRIVAAERKVHKALSGDASKRDLADTLGRTVHDLRKARLDRDADRSVQASEKLTALIPDLLAAVSSPDAKTPAP